jgi:hypothetical protein
MPYDKGYGRSAGMHALLISIYIIGAAIGCSFLSVGAKRPAVLSFLAAVFVLRHFVSPDENRF